MLPRAPIRSRDIFRARTFQKNVIVGGDAGEYPANNFFPATIAGVGFIDLSGANYALSAASPYKKAGTDGTDVGFIPF